MSSTLRQATVQRNTFETQITVTLNLDGTGQADISTGVGFFDHMLEQVAKHGLLDLKVQATGDLHIDMHHTVEDVGIALGQAVSRALGDKRGLVRYADCHSPMDETLTRVALDLSGRPFLVWRTVFSNAKIGDFDTELVREFFQAFSVHAGATLHVETLYGANNHHIAESCFKGLARVLRAATRLDPQLNGQVPSTKGMLEH